MEKNPRERAINAIRKAVENNGHDPNYVQKTPFHILERNLFGGSAPIVYGGFSRRPFLTPKERDEIFRYFVKI